MSLKGDIVVVNEYTVRGKNGRGSRGGTPGDYVTRYMSREQAVESLAPIQRLRTDDFIMRYMARETAVEHAVVHPGITPGVSRTEIKTAMRQAQGDGGVAFGYGSVSLSDEALRAAARDIQHHFDEGKTVLKTVLSFTEEYLKKHGIVDEDFHCEQRGDYRGHIDQMKLRMAIMHGLDRMSGSLYDDLRYIGVIQVDTTHVHCHLAMVDAGKGRVVKNGTQRGKLLDRHKSRLRRGIDAWLDEKQTVAHLSSAVGYERRNVTTFIKRWAHEMIRGEALPQFLIACLPDDQSLWRAGSTNQRMRKANQLITELVTEQLQRPDSPLPQAMERIVDYANHRRHAENLNTEEWSHLVEQGRRQITERAVNAVYQMLRSVPRSSLRIRTPMLDIMGMDYEQLAGRAAQSGDDGPDDLLSFGFRLRSYSSRLRHHKKQARTYDTLATQWERLEKSQAVTRDSYPLYHFYQVERDYHRQLMSKYQYFLPFIGDASAWYERFDEVVAYGQQLQSLRALRHDIALGRLTDPDKAEELGRHIYHQPGGRHLTMGAVGREILDSRIRTMTTNYADQLTALKRELADAGLSLHVRSSVAKTTTDEPSADRDESDEPLVTDAVIEPGTEYDFETVKALDLHHLTYDFLADVPVGHRACDAFIACANLRRQAIMGALAYLDNTGQQEMISTLPVDDVGDMVQMAQRIEQQRAAGGEAVLVSQMKALAAASQERHERRSATASLDEGLIVTVRDCIDDSVRASIDPTTLPSAIDVPTTPTEGLE